MAIVKTQQNSIQHRKHTRNTWGILSSFKGGYLSLQLLFLNKKNRCALGKICKDTNDFYRCKRLSPIINLLRVGRSAMTSYCVPFTNYLARGTYISNCADGFCIYTKNYYN